MKRATRTSLLIASSVSLAAACTTINQPPAPPPPLAPPAEMMVEQPCPSDAFQIYFASDQTDLDDVALAVIENIGKTAKTCEPSAIEVTGHSDAIGSEAVNLRVSQRRADIVLKALLEADLNVERIAIVAEGEEGAVTEDDLLVPMNRRVTVQLVN